MYNVPKTIELSLSKNLFASCFVHFRLGFVRVILFTSIGSTSLHNIHTIRLFSNSTRRPKEQSLYKVKSLYQFHVVLLHSLKIFSLSALGLGDVRRFIL